MIQSVESHFFGGIDILSLEGNGMMNGFRSSLTIKVVAFVAVLILAASLISIYVIYSLSINDLKSETEDTLKIIAANAVNGLDTDKLATIRTQADEGTATYLELQKKLQAVKEASMGKVRYVYTIAKSGAGYVYILDAEPIEDTANHSTVGSEFPLADFPEAANGFLRPTAEKTILYDKEFKIWSQSGYAPIKDSNGNVIGVLGVDMDVSVVMQREGQLNVRVAEALAIALLLALLSGVLFSRYVTRPIRTLTEGTRRVAKGDLGATVDMKRKDELGELAGAFNSMTKDIERSHGALAENNRELIRANVLLTDEIALRKLAQGKIETLAYYDVITGLPNRLLLQNRLDQALDLARRISRPLGILFMDLDGFKTFNDTMGHSQGDELLKIISLRLEKTIRKSDTVARMGGDEFVILLQNLKDASGIRTFADKIIEIFNHPITLNDQAVYVSFSVGISVFPIDGDTSGELIKNADVAMYKAKELGRNQYVFCSTIIKDTIAENMLLTNGLYRAIERKELEIYYQPEVQATTDAVIGFEALLRWNHPVFGRVLPGRFIHLAEQTGLINPIGEWVLRTVCNQNRKWQEAGLPIVRIAVNLSVVQFQNPFIVNQVKQILQETGLSPQYLELEITENISIKETSSVVRILQEFRDIGIYVSLDDFGTEYSSLTHLKHLPIDRLKIPMPFVHGIAVNEKDEAIIKAIIVMATSVGMDVIAEGVETKQQESFLMQKMCNVMQGYYYYKPMPAKDAEALLGQADRVD